MNGNKLGLSCKAVIALAVLSFFALSPAQSQTDGNGYILDTEWLVIGPFQTTVACDGNTGLFLQNFTAPTPIFCEYPEAGDEIEYDPALAASGSYLGPDVNGTGNPAWREYAGGGVCLVDLEADSPGDERVTYMATSFEYLGATPKTFQICASSDDGAVVYLDSSLATVYLNCAPPADCNGGGCNSTVSVEITPGEHRILFGIFEQGGGWGGALRIIDPDTGLGVTSDDPDFSFLGTAPIAPKECVLPPERTFGDSDCDAPSTPVTVSQPVPPGADAGEMVAVVEQVLGNISTDEVSAPGGAVSVLFGTGLTNQGFIQGWLHLGPFSRGGGAAPGEDQIILDYLTDGVDNFEDDIEPVAGDIVSTDFGGASAATGLAFSSDTVNPGGVPTWGAWNDTDDTIDYNQYYGGDINDIMMYSVTYIRLADPVDAADLCVGSDDSIQVLLNGEQVHINNIPRGWGAGCQDLVPLGALPAGDHQIMVKIFEGGGGHGFRLAILDSATGLAPEGMTVCLDPNFNEPCFPPIGLEINWNVTRQAVADGVGYSVNVKETALSFRGTVDGQFTVGASAAEFCPGATNPVTGQIREGQWAVLGPFSHLTACGGAAGNLLLNHLSPSNIACETPSIGDEVDYDPAAAVTTSYNGPVGPNGLPQWSAFDDGNSDGFLNLDAALGGDQVVAYCSTYFENISGGDLSLQLCFGSDDDGQAWVDGTAIHNIAVCRGTGGCNDVIPFSVSPGVHRLVIAAWDNGGGWAVNGAIQDENGVPIISSDDDRLRYLGPNKPDGFEIECPECAPEPVQITRCELAPLGLGEGLFLEWINPPGQDPAVPTRILVNGIEVATVATDDTSATIASGLLPAGTGWSADVIHCGGVPASCSPFQTDANGYVTSWLALGPIHFLLGGNACSGDPNQLTQPFIAPEHIGCQYPSEGDEVEVDEADPSQAGDFTDAALAKGPNNLPMWVRFDDGSPSNNDQDGETAWGNPDQYVAFFSMYVENTTANDVDVNACFGSDDDGQIWVDSDLVHNNAACRGRGDCQDMVPFTLTPGVHRIICAFFENGGGSGFRFQMRDANTLLPFVDADPASPISYLGINKPDGFDGPCVEPAQHVSDLVCEKEANGDVTLSWTPGEGNTAENTISVTANGLEVANLDFDDVEVTIPAGDVPAGVATFCVDTNGAPGNPPCCGILSGNEVYINCGGLQIVDADGRTWAEDTVQNPSPFLVSDNANAAGFGACDGVLNRDADPTLNEEQYPSEIMTTERWNDGLVEYSINGLDAGTYQVDLGFLEGCCSDGCGTGVAADSCEFVGEDGNPPARDPALDSVGGCRVFDIEINNEVVTDQFSQNLEASCLAGTDPGATSNCIAFVKRYTVEVTNGGGGDHGAAEGQITISIVDLGAGNPPENASIKFIAITPTTIVGGPRFVRGDTNADGGLNIADPVYELNRLFGGGPAMPCREAGDTNGDGGINIADPVYQLNRLFGGGPALPPPTSCADVPPPLSFPCDSFPPCGI